MDCTFNLNCNQYVWTYASDVDFVNCTFNCVDGKGVLVYNEGVAVDVNFTGCEFSSSKKATTSSGEPIAAIEISNSVNNPVFNVNIKDCTSKGGFAYDEYICRVKNDAKSMKNLNITVDGAIVTVSTNALKAAVSEAGATVNVMAGEYTFPSSDVAEGVTIVCAEGTVFTGNSKLNIKGATVVGATFSNPSGNAVDQTINGTFKNCTFTGSNGLRNCYIPAGKELLFEDCVFYGNTYGVHFDGGNTTGKVIFKNCDFTGWNSFASTVAKVEFYNCDFHKSGYGYLRFYQDGVVTDCTFDADFQTIDYGKTGCTTYFTNCTRVDGEFEKTIYRGDIKDNTIYIDGKKMLDYGVYEN